MFKHIFLAIAGFALLVSACDLFDSGDNKKDREVTNCTRIYDGLSGELRTRKYCEWNNSTKTLTVYKWKPGTGPSQDVYWNKQPLPDANIDRAKNTITVEGILFLDGIYQLDFDI